MFVALIFGSILDVTGFIITFNITSFSGNTVTDVVLIFGSGISTLTILNPV